MNSHWFRLTVLSWTNITLHLNNDKIEVSSLCSRTTTKWTELRKLWQIKIRHLAAPPEGILRVTAKPRALKHSYLRGVSSTRNLPTSRLGRHFRWAPLELFLGLRAPLSRGKEIKFGWSVAQVWSNGLILDLIALVFSPIRQLISTPSTSLTLFLFQDSSPIFCALILEFNCFHSHVPYSSQIFRFSGHFIIRFFYQHYSHYLWELHYLCYQFHFVES